MSDSPDKPKPRPAAHAPVKMPGWMFYPLLLGTLGGAGYVLRQGDVVFSGSIVLVALLAGLGFRMGLANIAASVIALVAAVQFAPTLGLRWEDRFAAQFGTTGLTNRWLCMLAIGVLISLVVTTLLTMITGRFLMRRRKWDWFNSHLGLLTGLAEGVLVVLLFLGAMIQFDTGEDGQWNEVISSVAENTRDSALGPWVNDYNPFERVPPLAQVEEVRDSVRHFRDPENVKNLLEDPRIAELRDDPAVRMAIESIRSDKRVREFLAEGTVDGELIWYVMSHPAVMALSENEDFAERAAEIIREQ